MRWLSVLVLIAACSKPSGKVHDIGTACTRNGDCAGNLCLPIATDRTVCTSSCSNNDACPAGWSCVASNGSSLCDCTPSVEVCDGIDNDCNGIVDDGCGGEADLSGADLALPPLPSTGKIDILFVVDDSPSMTPIQTQLKAAFPTFAKALDQFPSKNAASSFHIGVVTSDLGSGPTMISANCKPGGLGGKLQPLGRAHDAACVPVTGGANYIDIDQVAGTNNLPASQDLPATFTCMASVGDQGCGFEHQLESAYKALHDNLPENAGFLRDDALLVIVWVTNEDDCSAPPTTDLFDPTKVATYGAELSYRCTHYGIMCGNPPMLSPYADSGGPLAMCQGATGVIGGKLFEVDRYLNYFTKAGGVKSNPRGVFLASLAAPPTPFQVITGDPSTNPYDSCAPGAMVGTQGCAVLLQHSCIQSASISGDPAVRISQVVHGAAQFLESSVCAADYTAPLQSIADQILQLRLGM